MTPQRVQLSRRKGWRKPANTVVVARPSKWGNPWPWADRVREDGATPAAARQAAVDQFADMVAMREDFTYPSIPVIRMELGGKNLACWCPLDQPCHADVLLRIANRGAA